MSRSVALVLAWLIAAGGTLAVAWRGVAVVGDQVTDDRPAPLTAEELGAPAEDPTSTSVPGSATSTDPPAPTTAVGGPDQPEPETRPYPLIGGTVTLQFAPSGVTVLDAVPNQGFSVEVEPEHGNGWKVEFRSESHRSRVDGWWDGGPQDRVREEPER